ncbi:response regulator transcription factor [Actinoplanes sp. TBRC 11911]|uniref:response regulator transcription factor n=1 Tax=Actinoplanes sp. TBRC 11911 TaxID=2729386 RepID=UPI00145EF898|nr:response regulator transcription factor [Actinoplanes sp. TBRC 11911]NMO49665.1 response regulator transcription factor [Actinoplanes sp. TBRC 11911]
MNAETVIVDVVSRNTIIRGGLMRVLAEAPGIAARHELDSLAALRSEPEPPDIALVDLYETEPTDLRAYLPDGCRAVALYPPEHPPSLTAALRGGAHALLTRRTTTGELLAAIETVRHGGIHICAELAREIIGRDHPATAERGSELTPREIETLQWVALGLTHTQVGRRLGLTESTVSTYIRRIRTKLHASNKADLTRRAIELGYVSPR